MVDPHRGFELASLYRMPINAIVAHPVLLLGLVAGGVGLAVGATALCRPVFDQFQCVRDVRALGWGLAGVGVAMYGLFKVGNRVSDD